LTEPPPLRALLLAGGYGTRLGALGREGPKALLPLGGRPLADHLLSGLRSVPGLEELVVVTNARFVRALEGWAEAARTRASFPVRVLHDGTSDPEERLGAVGDLGFALERMEPTGNLMVLASDSLPGFPLRDFARELSRRPRAELLLAVRSETEPERLEARGVVSLDPEERVTLFQEKPRDPASRDTALPFYLFRRRILPRIPEYLASGAERDAPGHLVRWLVDRVRVEGWRAPGEGRIDVGTPEAYAEARRRFEGGR
jgi:glucose-1-phosphate thymidylyltransferase